MNIIIYLKTIQQIKLLTNLNIGKIVYEHNPAIIPHYPNSPIVMFIIVIKIHTLEVQLVSNNFCKL